MNTQTTSGRPVPQEQVLAQSEDAEILRVGLVGAGVIGLVHRGVYEQLNGVEVVALADPRGAEVLSQAGAAYVPGSSVEGPQDLPVYATLAELLDNENVDIVDICAPTIAHRELSIEAIEAGKHVLCEKPMGRTVEDCDAVIEAAQTTDRRYMVAHCLRFWPVYEFLNEIVTTDQYGRVELAKFARQVIVPAGGWFLDGKVSGGAILGAFFIVLAEEILSQIVHEWRLIYGPLLVLMVLYAKGGLSDLFSRKGARNA